MMRHRTSINRRQQSPAEGQTPIPQRSTRKSGSGRGRGAAAEASVTHQEKIALVQPSSTPAPAPVDVRSKRRSSPTPRQGEQRRSQAEPTKAKKNIPQGTESAPLTPTPQKCDAVVSYEVAALSPRCSEDAAPSSAEVIATLSADEISQRLSSLREMLVQEGTAAGSHLEDCLPVAVDLGFELVERNKKQELEISRLAHDVDELRRNMEALPVGQTSSPPTSEHFASLKTAVMEEAQQECLRLGNQNFMNLMSDTMEFLHTMIERAEVAESTARMLLSMLEAEKPPAEKPPAETRTAEKPSEQSPSYSAVPDSKPSFFVDPNYESESVTKATLASSQADVQLGLDMIGRSRVAMKNEICKQPALSGFSLAVPCETQTQAVFARKGLESVPQPMSSVGASPHQSIRRSLVSAPGTLSPTFLTPAVWPHLAQSSVHVANVNCNPQVSPPPRCTRGSSPIEQAPARAAILSPSSFKFAPYLQPANMGPSSSPPVMGPSSSPPVMIRSPHKSRPSSQDAPVRYRTVSPQRRSEQGQLILQTPPQEQPARWSSCGVSTNLPRSINLAIAPATGPSSPSTSTRYTSRAVTPSAAASQRIPFTSQLFDKLDANHDGVITKEEWNAAVVQ